MEMSVWDTERTFTPLAEESNINRTGADNKKRKRGDQLLPAEVWRAKNVSVGCFRSAMQPVESVPRSPMTI